MRTVVPVLVGLRRVALVLALLALLVGLGNRPTPAPTPPPELDVLVAVDRTTSMSALDDPTGSRITAVRQDLARLGRLLDPAQFSVVTFGIASQLALPFTADREAYRSTVRRIEVEEATSGAGTSVGAPVGFLVEQLDRAAATWAEDVDPDVLHVPVLVFVTDGENTVDLAQPSFARLGDRVRAGVVLGYGTTEGGVMPLARVPADEDPPPAGDPGPVVPAGDTGQPAVSHLDEVNLTTIAGQLGLGYVHADGTQSMTDVAAAIERTAYAQLPPVEPERELRWLWALLVLVLAAAELRLGWRRLAEALRVGGR